MAEHRLISAQVGDDGPAVKAGHQDRAEQGGGREQEQQGKPQLHHADQHRRGTGPAEGGHDVGDKWHLHQFRGGGSSDHEQGKDGGQGPTYAG